MRLNRISISFERKSNKLKINSNLIILEPSFDKRMLGLTNYLAINLDLSKHEEDFITFKIFEKITKTYFVGLFTITFVEFWCWF